jgi:hypothetical protein
LLTGFETSLLAVQTPKIPAAERDLASKTLPWGTEFLDGGQSGLKDRKRHRRPKERNDTRAKILTETAYPESAQGFAVSQDWMVAEAVSRNRSRFAGTGNSLKIPGQNRLPSRERGLTVLNSTAIAASYSSAEALSCYSAKQAVKARKQALRSAKTVVAS